MNTYPIPEDLKAIYDMMLGAWHLGDHGRLCSDLIERIARLESEAADVDEYLPEPTGPYQTLAERAKLLKDQMEYAAEDAGNWAKLSAAADERIARLTARISDAEFANAWDLEQSAGLGTVLDAFIAERAKEQA